MEKEQTPSERPETSVETTGKQYVHDLKNALRPMVDAPEIDPEQVLSVLRKIGETIEALKRGREEKPAYVQYDALSRQFMIGLGSASSGKRIMINTASYGSYPYDLIFPNAETIPNSSTKLSYADAFRKIFGSAAERIVESDPPFFVVRLGLKWDKEKEKD